jgi:hypothetical protein
VRAGRSGVRFSVPADVAFAYLVDPHHRAEWQSSLRRVEDVRPALPVVGQTWVDVTVPGPRPLMETTVLERPDTWTEVGSWHGVEATLTLDLAPTSTGCLVVPTFRVSGTGVARPVAFVVDRLAALGVYPDLRRAARILAAR